MKVVIFKEIPKHELNDSAINKRETITFQTNTDYKQTEFFLKKTSFL